MPALRLEVAPPQIKTAYLKLYGKTVCEDDVAVESDDSASGDESEESEEENEEGDEEGDE